MTRLAVLGDIHGNLPALEAVWDDLSRFDVDHVIVAGDTVNWGPFSLEVLEFLADHHCAMLRGNHEYYVLDYDTPRAAPGTERYTLPPHTHRQIGDRWRARIAAWPDTLSLRFADAPPIHVLHGSVGNPWLGVYPTTSDEEAQRLLDGVEESVVIAAHTHLALDRTVNGRRILNPGSVGVPLDGDVSASYMLLETENGGWQVRHRRLPFDLERLLAEFERERFTEIHGVTGHLLIREFRTARCQVAPFLRWRNACCPDAPESLDLLEQFTDKVRWKYTAEPFHVNLDTP